MYTLSPVARCEIVCPTSIGEATSVITVGPPAGSSEDQNEPIQSPVGSNESSSLPPLSDSAPIASSPKNETTGSTIVQSNPPATAQDLKDQLIEGPVNGINISQITSSPPTAQDLKDQLIEGPVNGVDSLQSSPNTSSSSINTTLGKDLQTGVQMQRNQNHDQNNSGSNLPSRHDNASDSIFPNKKDTGISSTISNNSKKDNNDNKNNPPIVQDQSFTTTKEAPVKIALYGNDPDGDTIKFEITGKPLHGKIKNLNLLTGSLVFTRNPVLSVSISSNTRQQTIEVYQAILQSLT